MILSLDQEWFFLWIFFEDDLYGEGGTLTRSFGFQKDWRDLDILKKEKRN